MGFRVLYRVWGLTGLGSKEFGGLQGFGFIGHRV